MPLVRTLRLLLGNLDLDLDLDPDLLGNLDSQSYASLPSKMESQISPAAAAHLPLVRTFRSRLGNLP